MNDLITVLKDCFENFGRHLYNYSPNTSDINFKSFMVIPVSEDVFEIPMFVHPSFINMVKCNELKPIVVNLNYTGSTTSYKSLESAIKSALLSDYRQPRFVKLPSKPDEKTYYASYGAIFDSEYNPVVLISWQIKKVCVGSRTKYQYIQPILRIAPEVIINRSNTMERFIVNKILSNVLTFQNISYPSDVSSYLCRDLFIMDINRKKVKVLLEDMPFEIRHPQVPSVATTNEELSNIAINALKLFSNDNE